MPTSDRSESPDLATQDDIYIAGRVFGTPVVTKGLTWLPLAELGGWLVMSWYAGNKRPERTWLARLGMGGLTTPILLGSEWCHNLAHAAAAQWVGKPMDALRVTWGMPLLVYYDIEDQTVTPRQHIIRALGGPIFNTGLLALCLAMRPMTKPGRLAREVADIAIGTNAFLSAVSLLPIPGIDGGPILKWSLVQAGKTPQEADQIVCKANSFLGVLLAFISAWLLKRRKRLLGAFLALLSALAIGVATGLIREEKSSPWLKKPNPFLTARNNSEACRSSI